MKKIEANDQFDRVKLPPRDPNDPTLTFSPSPEREDSKEGVNGYELGQQLYAQAVREKVNITYHPVYGYIIAGSRGEGPNAEPVRYLSSDPKLQAEAMKYFESLDKWQFAHVNRVDETTKTSN